MLPLNPGWWQRNPQALETEAEDFKFEAWATQRDRPQPNKAISTVNSWTKLDSIMHFMSSQENALFFLLKQSVCGYAQIATWHA